MPPAGGDSFGQRLRRALLKPVPDDGPDQPSEELSVDELGDRARWANDQERLLGVVAAPLAAVIGILVGGNEISLAEASHRNIGTYQSLLAVLCALSVAMLVTALLRRRLYLGMAMALYGLAVFNLHYWGFGVPYIMGAAWLLVRAYRLQRDYRVATEGGPSGPGPGGRARPSKRYTPPTRRPRPSEDR